MTPELREQIFTTWLPLGIMLIFGLIGVFRGALRESVLGAAVTLAAFINSQWASQWGSGVNEVYSGLSRQDSQFYISIVVLWATALILGYGLGSLLGQSSEHTPHRLTPLSRLLGGLLGLVSGAALAGWTLRYIITNTDGTLEPGTFLDNAVSRGFIIWATWFPLMLAFMGALLVIIGPLRRMQGSVGRPDPVSDWKPSSPAVPVMRPGIPAPPVPTGMTNLTNSSMAVTQEHARIYPSPGAPQPPAVSPWAAPPSYMNSAPVTRPVEPPVADTLRFGEGAPPVPARVTSSESVTAPYNTVTPPAPASSQDGDTATYPSRDSDLADEPSWLLQQVPDSTVGAGAPATEETPAADTATGQVFANGEPAAPRAADTAAFDVVSRPEPVANTGSERVCPNCGAVASPGSSFCTQCGTKLV